MNDLMKDIIKGNYELSFSNRQGMLLVRMADIKNKRGIERMVCYDDKRDLNYRLKEMLTKLAMAERNKND